MYSFAIFILKPNFISLPEASWSYIMSKPLEKNNDAVQEPNTGLIQEPNTGITQEPNTGFIQEPNTGDSDQPDRDDA